MSKLSLVPDFLANPAGKYLPQSRKKVVDWAELWCAHAEPLQQFLQIGDSLEVLQYSWLKNCVLSGIIFGYNIGELRGKCHLFANERPCWHIASSLLVWFQP